MKRFSAVALATLLVLSSLAVSGCSNWFQDPAKPANDAIKSANAHLKKAATEESAISDEAAKLDGVAYTKAGAKDALAITKGIRASLKTMKDELSAAKADMDGVAKLEVAKEFKQYAKLEAAAIDTRMTIADTQARLYDAIDVLYDNVAKPASGVDPQEILVAIDQIRSEITALNEQATERAKAASDYFTANKLGG